MPRTRKTSVKAKELESVEDIVGRIKELERQSEGMMVSILEGLYE